MTGSSARKLRRTGVNLLGGRAIDRTLHPLVSTEIDDFDLVKAMNRGLLPSHYLSDEPDEDLRAYVGRYLTEEIAAEGFSRNIPSFARFLETAACCNSQILNYTNIASDAAVSRQTATNYFQILRDTLLGYDLPPFKRSQKRKAIETPKFFFFDLGVVRSLRKLGPISNHGAEFGEFFEHFIFLELRSWIDYTKPAAELEYWRSTSGFEVDFVLNGKIAIEVKSTSRVTDSHLKGLNALREEKICTSFILVANEPERRNFDGIEIIPWREFLKDLWNDRFE